MTNFIDADVIIVGGGLAGAAAALALTQAELEVIVIDARPAPAAPDAPFDGRAYSLALGSRRMLEAVGVWPAIDAAAQPVRDVVVSDGRPGERAAPQFLHFDHRDSAEGVLSWMVEDRHLRPALDAAMDAAGVTRRAARVGGVDYEAGRASVRLEDGETLRATLVLACDGAESPLGRAAGLRFVRWSYAQNGLVSAVSFERPHEGVAHELFLPAGPFAILPLVGARASLVWTETRREAKRIHGLPDDLYLAELRRRFGDFLGDVTLEGGRWTYPLRFALAHDWVAPRLALLGDAAHAVHPIAGQGLNLGLRDAAALAEVLAEALRRGEDIGALDVLRRYQAWRRFDASGMALGMDALNRLFSNDSGLTRLIRDAGLAAVNAAPALKRRFMGEAAGRAGDIPRLLAGKPL